MDEHFYFYEDEGVVCPYCDTENFFEDIPIYEDEGNDYIICDGCGESIDIELDEVSKERKMELYKKARKQTAKGSAKASRERTGLKDLSMLSRRLPSGDKRRRAMGHTYGKMMRWPTISRYKKLLSKEPGVDVKTLYSPKKTRPTRERMLKKSTEQMKKTAERYGI